MCRKYRCKTCEEKKVTNIKKQGKIPLKERKNLKPFETLSVDLCGPWRCKFTVERNISEKPNEKKIQTRIEEADIWALTMIDEATSWPEVYPITTKDSGEIARAVDDQWLCRYPRPHQITTPIRKIMTMTTKASTGSRRWKYPMKPKIPMKS